MADNEVRVDIHQANERAWDVAAATYAASVQQHVALLLAGGSSLLPQELHSLGDLRTGCNRAIHLQCSHGLDALSLWKTGAREVIGVDISEAMLAQARAKTQLLSAPARWVHSDVLAVPAELDGTADLVYTGKGALNWMMDLEAWAGVVCRLLRPAGRLFIFEGHPLNWVWDSEASEFRFCGDGRSYFDAMPRPNRNFPASAIARHTPDGQTAPQALEHQWTLGTLVTTLVTAGLVLERLEEYPEHFWNEFTNIPPDQVRRLPHTFSLLMRKA
jgi:SAM-dependent methyltransferase